MKTIHWQRPLALALVGVLALLGVGCASTNIARLMAEPNRYANRDVRLTGDVVESVSLLGHGAYKLDDGTGSIWVVSRRGVPRRGARVEAKGRIRDVVDVSTLFKLPEQIGSGMVMVEDSHRAR
jgi:hypothetical protein